MQVISHIEDLTEEARLYVRENSFKKGAPNMIWKFNYNANDDQPTMWKDNKMQVLRPKGRREGLMVSDFIEERDRYLAIPDPFTRQYRKMTHPFHRLQRRNIHYVHSSPFRCLITLVDTRHLYPIH